MTKAPGIFGFVSDVNCLCKNGDLQIKFSKNNAEFVGFVFDVNWCAWNLQF